MKRRPRPQPDGAVLRQGELELSIFVRAGEAYGDRPLYHEIVDLASCAGLRGATVVRGLQGFGARASLRPTGFAWRSGNEPVLIQITDDAARVRAFLPAAEQLVGSGLIVTKAVTSVRRATDVPDIAASTATGGCVS